MTITNYTGDIPEIYVDSIRMAVGLFDFAFELGLQQISSPPGAGPPRIKTLAIVRMSPQHAYVLSKLLQKNVQAYETNVGPIALPADVLKGLGIS